MSLPRSSLALALLAALCWLSARVSAGGQSDYAYEDDSPRCPDAFLEETARRPQLDARTLQQLGNLTRPDRLRELTWPLIATPRPVGSAGHAAARAHLVAALRRLGWLVQLDAFAAGTPVGRRRFASVVASRPAPPGTPEEAAQSPRQVLVLGAHYDSAPLPGGNFVGATDSAVSCAILLMLAEALDALKTSAAAATVQVRVVFFDGEESLGGVWTTEDSLYGSRHLALRWATEDGAGPGCPAIAQVSRLVLLDLLGGPGPRIAYARQPGGPPHLAAREAREFRRLAAAELRLRAAGLLPEAAGHPATFFVPPKGGRADPLDTVEDDHAPFRRLGVPALHLVPRPFPAVWHTDRDTGSHVHWGHSAAVARVLLTWLLETPGVADQ